MHTQQNAVEGSLQRKRCLKNKYKMTLELATYIEEKLHHTKTIYTVCAHVSAFKEIHPIRLQESCANDVNTIKNK